jgi:hypothetical protein
MPRNTHYFLLNINISAVTLGLHVRSASSDTRLCKLFTFPSAPQIENDGGISLFPRSIPFACWAFYEYRSSNYDINDPDER